MRITDISPSDINGICHLYTTGVGSPTIAREYSINEWNVRSVLLKNGVTLRPSFHSVLKYDSNHNFFDVIDTPEKAWCLGLMFSDGTIDNGGTSNNAIRLRMADRDVIEKFKKCLSSESPISKDQDKRPNRQPSYGLRVSSVGMVKSLSNHGCVPRKTEILRFPTTIPPNMIPHFIRGYFDGDGSLILTNITKKVEIVGTEDLINGIWKEFVDNGIRCGTIHQDKRSVNLYSVSVSNYLFKELYIYLYTNSSQSNRMDRKYDKFTNYINSL